MFDVLYPFVTIIGENQIPVKFVGCHFALGANYSNGSNQFFIGGVYERAQNPSIKIEDCTYASASGQLHFLSDTGPTGLGFPNNRLVCTPNQRSIKNYLTSTDYTVINGSFNNRTTTYSSTSSGFSWNLSTKTMTFTASEASYYLVGDYLFWQMYGFDSTNTYAGDSSLLQGRSLIGYKTIALKVTAKSGSSGSQTITCSLILDPVELYNQTYAPSNMDWPLMEWAPTTASLTGLCTAGTANIQLVSTTNIVQTGDWIYTDSGFSSIQRVLLADTVNANLTLTSTASTTTTANLYLSRLVPLYGNTQAAGYINSYMPSYTGNLTASIVKATGNIVAGSSTVSTSTTTGALVVAGGVGLGGNLNVAGNVVQQAGVYGTFSNITNVGGNLTCNFNNGTV
ncbi:MAG: hypothetical protein EBX50_21865 [Chitinophagia bacterium]|nr:hypothetical protein [Chitinophagia bacterium]